MTLHGGSRRADTDCRYCFSQLWCIDTRAKLRGGAALCCAFEDELERL